MLRCDRRKLGGLAGALATMLIVVAQVRSQPPETAWTGIRPTGTANRDNTLLAQAQLLNYLEPEFVSRRESSIVEPAASRIQQAAFGSDEPSDLIGTELLLNEAVMSYHDGRYAEAWRQLQLLDRADPTVAYYRGLALQALGRTDAAAGEFQSSGIQSPISDNWQSPMASQAFASEDAEEAPEPRPWNLTLLTGIEYDSNIRLAPNFGGLGSGIKRNDGRVVAALFGDYLLWNGEGGNLGLLGSVYQSGQFQLSEFNISNFMGGFYANKTVGEHWLLGTNYQLNETLLDGNQFSLNHRLVGNATYLASWGHSTAYYEFDNIDLSAPALIAAQKRSGTTNSVGVTQAIYLLEGAGRLYFGYRYGRTSSDGSDFDFNSNMVTARVEVPLEGLALPFLNDCVVDAEYRYFRDCYDNANSLDFFGRTRRDNRSEVRAGLQKFFNKNVSVRLDYTYVHNQSNVANLFDVHFYEYNRHIVSTQLIYDF
ncbi:MAG: hypothetical protein IAG10_29870 [Planctomycetaceae bacterium]|nr:hypothetical protein [Planctomycetaceae bacterium]